MSDRLASAVNETWWRMPERMTTHIPDREARLFGNVRACYGALPGSAGNAIFVFEPDLGDLQAAMSWLADRNGSYDVIATPSAAEAIAADLDSLGLEKHRESPGMALPSLDEVPATESVASFSEVTDPHERNEFCSLFVEAFEASPEFPEQLTTQAVLNDDSYTHLIARQNEQPVACGILLRHEEAAGVFSVGVPPEFRRQGLGEAMTWALLRAGRDAGCTIGVLNSSDMGQPLYEQMGFETVVTYHHFEPVS